MQVLELIIFAGLAAIVLYQLYSVLGRRVGRQPEDTPAAEATQASVRAPDRAPEPLDDGVALTGLAAMKAKDPAFDVSRFLNGAKGAYEGFAVNREPQLRVIEKHRAHAHKLNPTFVPLDLLAAARDSWDQAIATAREHGVRNSQVSVLAPTGTIAFMMDCDTTGVEPDIA